jgi:hypothetical protein
MEDYEKAELESAPLKPHCWFCYMDNTFAIPKPPKQHPSIHSVHHGNQK